MITEEEMRDAFHDRLGPAMSGLNPGPALLESLRGRQRRRNRLAVIGASAGVVAIAAAVVGLTQLTPDTGRPVASTGQPSASVASGAIINHSAPPLLRPVPNVIGESLDQAESELTKAGFTVVTRFVTTEAAGPGLILAQAPAADSSWAAGTTVTITASGAAQTSPQPPSVSPGPTLPPAPFDSSQSIATLSGADHHWMNGSHTFTIAAGGTLSFTAECYGTGSLTLTIGANTPTLLTTPCENSNAYRNMVIATVPLDQYARYDIQSGAPAIVTVTRTGGTSDQWRVQVQRNAASSSVQSSP